MYFLTTRLWVPRLGDVELYDMTLRYGTYKTTCDDEHDSYGSCLRNIELHNITLFCSDNLSICKNEHHLHNHSSCYLLSPYKLRSYEKAIFMINGYHIIIDITIKPKHICLLLYLLFWRILLHKHDYLIMQSNIRCWITMLPIVKQYRKGYSLTHQGHHIGGGISELFTYTQLLPYLLKNSMMIKPSADLMYKFEGHHIETKQVREDIAEEHALICSIPLDKFVTNLTIPNLKLVAAAHGIFIKSRTPLAEVIKIIQDHDCDQCQNFITVFKPAKSLLSRRREANVRAVRKYKNNKICLNNKISVETGNKHYHKGLHRVSDTLDDEQIFPPSSLEHKIEHAIVKAWCKDMSPKNFEEVGCAVCGELSLRSKSVLLKDASVNLNILHCSYNIT